MSYFGSTLRSLLLAAVIAPQVAYAAPLEKITVAVGADGVQLSALHIAIGGGFFKEEGLDVNIVDVNSGPRQVAALMGGSALFVPVGLIQEIKINAQGGALASAANMFAVIDQQVVISNAALKKTGITPDMPLEEKLKRMKGLKIGVTAPGSTTDTVIRSLYKARGMDADQMLQIQPLGEGVNMLASFEQGLTDGFVISAPFPQIAAHKGLGQVIINPFIDDIPEMKGATNNVMAINRNAMEKNADQLRRSVRALTKALKFAHENPDGAKEILKKHFSSVDPEVFDIIWENYRKGLPTTPVVSEEMFNKTQEWLNISSKTPVSTKFSDVIANQFAIEAAKEILPPVN